MVAGKWPATNQDFQGSTVKLSMYSSVNQFLIFPH